jgi:SET domain-containing protein
MVSKLKRPLKLEVCLTPLKGWGVFATSPIYLGEIIEECPLIEIPKKAYQCAPDLFRDYAFESLLQNNIQVLPLGLGCIYNHSENPNAKWKLHPENSKIFQFISIKEIMPGEEICTSYGGAEYWKERSHVKVV